MNGFFMFNAIVDQAKYWSSVYRLFSDYNHIHLESFKKTMIENRGIVNLELFNDTWLSNLDRIYEKELKSKRFTSILSSYVDSLIDYRKSCKSLGFRVNEIDELFYESKKQLFGFPSAKEIENHPTATPSEVIYSQKKIELIHYANNNQNAIPVILVYAQINRFNIMDLMPEKSVIRNLISHGFDVYVIHWGYSGIHDDVTSMDDYIRCLNESVDMIREKTSRPEISMIGYCWGGILSLVYSSLFKEKIKNLVIMATPVDFSKDTSYLSLWAKDIDVDKMIDEFGHMDPLFLDVGFIMRNPSRNFEKYFKMLSRLNDQPFLDNFFAVEKWLHNTPPIPGEYFRKIIKDGYKNNLFIKNEVKVLDKTVDLKNIDMPLLTVVAEKDDLVTPASTLELHNYVSCADKISLSYKGGHVGLCISSHAQKTLWPKIARWLLQKPKTENISKTKETELAVAA